MTFERWTDRARKVAVLAGEEARMARRPAIGCEHLLLAMIREGECVAFRALDKLGITREAVIEATGPYHASAGLLGHIPFTPEARKIISEYALREALELSQNFVGTEHLLLAMVRREGTATDLLVRCGVSGLAVRAAVLSLLHGYEQAEQQSAPPSVAKLEAPPVAPERAHDFPAGLVDLAVMLADLDGFIERKAAELARPATEEAERSRLASEARVTDLQQEFGRQLRAMERQNGRLRERLAAAGLADD